MATSAYPWLSSFKVSDVERKLKGPIGNSLTVAFWMKKSSSSKNGFILVKADDVTTTEGSSDKEEYNPLLEHLAAIAETPSTATSRQVADIKWKKWYADRYAVDWAFYLKKNEIVFMSVFPRNDGATDALRGHANQEKSTTFWYEESSFPIFQDSNWHHYTFMIGPTRTRYEAQLMLDGITDSSKQDFVKCLRIFPTPRATYDTANASTTLTFDYVDNGNVNNTKTVLANLHSRIDVHWSCVIFRAQ